MAAGAAEPAATKTLRLKQASSGKVREAVAAAAAPASAGAAPTTSDDDFM